MLKSRVALFIDCENVPAKHWPTIRGRSESLGHLNTARLFGDFTEDRLARWLKIARDHSLQPVLQLGGKNAADISIAIAAMDTLHVGKTEAVVLVTSDQDLSSLAIRLRNAGTKVLGLGQANTPSALRNACSEFIELGCEEAAPKPQPKSQPKSQPKPQPKAA